MMDGKPSSRAGSGFGVTGRCIDWRVEIGFRWCVRKWHVVGMNVKVFFCQGMGGSGSWRCIALRGEG